MKSFNPLFDFLWNDVLWRKARKLTCDKKQTSNSNKHSNRQYSNYSSDEAYRGTDRECETEYYGDEDPDCGFRSYDSGCGYNGYDDDSSYGYSYDGDDGGGGGDGW